MRGEKRWQDPSVPDPNPARPPGKTIFRPPYVGPAGWIGVEMARIDDDRLGALVREGFLLVTAKDRRARTGKPSRRRTRATTP